MIEYVKKEVVKKDFEKAQAKLKKDLDMTLSNGSKSADLYAFGEYFPYNLEYYPNRARMKIPIPSFVNPLRIGNDNAHQGKPHIDYMGSKTYFSQETLMQVGNNIGSIALGEADPELCVEIIYQTLNATYSEIVPQIEKHKKEEIGRLKNELSLEKAESYRLIKRIISRAVKESYRLKEKIKSFESPRNNFSFKHHV